MGSVLCHTYFFLLFFVRASTVAVKYSQKILEIVPKYMAIEVTTSLKKKNKIKKHIPKKQKKTKKSLFNKNKNCNAGMVTQS